MQSFRRFIGYTALSVSLASPAPAQTPAQTPGQNTATASPGWWSKPGFLPAQAALSIRPVDVRVQGFSGMARSERYCEVNGTPLAPRTGLIPDTGNFYIVSLDRSGKQCELTPLVSIKPANPAIAQELLDSIDARVPGGAKFIKGQVKTGMEQFKVDAAPKHMPGVGVVVPAESPSALALLFALSTGNTGTRPQVAAPAGTPLTGEWWNKPNLLPTSPQGTISAGGRDATGNCRINQNGLQLVAVPEGSIVLTDTTRAFAVLANCRVEPLITLPARSTTTQPAISVAGGGLRNPGNIQTGPDPRLSQASAVAPPIIYPTAATLVDGLALLSVTMASATPLGWIYTGAAIFATGAYAYTAWDVKQSSQLSSTEVGGLAEASLNIRPDGDEINFGIERNNSRGTELANGLRPPGNCGDDQYKNLFNKKDRACPRVLPGCKDVVLDPTVRAVRAAAFVACAKAREELNRVCFDGGDDAHKSATKNAWEAAKNCLN